MARLAGASAKVRTVTFRYVAVAGQNRIVKGKVRAAGEVEAQNLLVQRGYTPISLEQAPSALSLEAALPSLFTIKLREIVTFSRQLATLLESGVTLLPALELLQIQASTSRLFRRILTSVSRDLGSGNSFSQAMAKHPQVFNEIYIRTMAVGERMGNMETMLRQMADYMQRQEAFTKKLKGAMTYPMILGLVGIVVVFILLTVALPPMADMFRSLKVELPLPTRILMGLATFVGSYKLHILAVVAVLVPTVLWYARRPQGRRAKDRLILRIPLIGPATHMMELGRLARTMSMLLGAGLSLQEILDVAPQTTTNRVFQEALGEARRGLFLGQGLTEPLAASALFPPLFLQMVKVGEESNTLEANLRVMADFYEAAAEDKTALLLSMIQPVSTILMAGGAGFIALSVIMPMYNITSAF